MKPILLAASLLLLSLSACPAAVPQAVEPTLQATSSENSQPIPQKEPLVITSETKDPRLPEILFPGLELKVIAGTGEAGYLDGPALEAQFNTPSGLAVSDTGDIFISDSGNHCIRKLNYDGIIETIICNSVKESKLSEYIYNPVEIQYLSNQIFILGSKSLIRFDLNSDVIFPLLINDDRLNTWFSPISQAYVKSPPVDFALFNGNLVFLSGNTVQKINLDTQKIVKIAGQDEIISDKYDPYQYYRDGLLSQARFNFPVSMAFMSPYKLIIADRANRRIRLMNLHSDNAYVSTLAGKEWDLGFGEFIGGFRDGDITEAMFNVLGNLATDSENNIWIVDYVNNALRLIHAKKEMVITLIKNIKISNIHSKNHKVYFTIGHRIYEMDLSNFDFDQLTPQVLENELH